MNSFSILIVLFVVFLQLCSISSETGRITLKGPITALEHSDVNITDKVYNGGTNISWTLNKKPLILSENTKTGVVGKDFFLYLKDVSPEQSGTYQVTIRRGESNKKKVYGSIDLAVVNEVPEVSKLKLDRVGTHFVILTWKSVNYVRTADNFIIEQYNSDQWEIIRQVKQNRIVIEGLTEGEKYSFRVFGENAMGRSEQTNTLSVIARDPEECFLTNCVNCKGDNHTCSRCNDGFFLNKIRKHNHFCQACPTKNCITCLTKKGPHDCTACRGGYTLKDGRCEKINVPNCFEMDGDFCKYCNFGFTKAWDGTCIPCAMDNCKFCSSAGKCLYCNGGYSFTNGGKCKLIVGKCGPTPKNCGSCINNICRRCSNGYFMDGDKCTDCSEMAAKCTRCNSRTSTCQICKFGYKPSVDGKTCQEIIYKEPVMKHVQDVSYFNDIEEVKYDDDVIDNDDEEDIEEDDKESNYKGDEGDEFEKETEEIEDDPDTDTHYPTVGWGFPEMRENATIYLEVEVQFHVAVTTWMTYLTKFRGNHYKALKALDHRYQSAYNFLGFAVNRLIMDDQDGNEIFVEIVPWEIMIYADNYPAPISLTLKNSEPKVPNHSLLDIKGFTPRSWENLLQKQNDVNGAVADTHMIFSTSGLRGAVTGAATHPIWLGTAIGGDSPGGLVGHELGHTMGMPDYPGTGRRNGLAGSYYSSYQVVKMKRHMHKTETERYLKKSICNPVETEDGRMIGRVQIPGKYYSGMDLSREQLCQDMMGKHCHEAKSSREASVKTCQSFQCDCMVDGKIKTKNVGQKFERGLECGVNKYCLNKKCESSEEVLDVINWRKDYSVGDSQCKYGGHEEVISTESLVKGYGCIDDLATACLFAPLEYASVLMEEKSRE